MSRKMSAMESIHRHAEAHLHLWRYGARQEVIDQLRRPTTPRSVVAMTIHLMHLKDEVEAADDIVKRLADLENWS